MPSARLFDKKPLDYLLSALECSGGSWPRCFNDCSNMSEVSSFTRFILTT